LSKSKRNTGILEVSRRAFLKQLGIGTAAIGLPGLSLGAGCGSEEFHMSPGGEALPILPPLYPMCQRTTNPVAVYDTTPEFSWMFPGVGENGSMQAAFQIKVASTRSNIDADIGDLWDSGMVPDKSMEADYDGSPLHRNTTCFWKIRTWSTDGSVSPYCDVQSFTMDDQLLDISPRGEVVSNHVDTYTITYTVGSTGIRVQDGFALFCPWLHDTWWFSRDHSHYRWSTWMGSLPWNPGYATFSTSRPGATISGRVVGVRRVLELTVNGADLVEGDTVTITWNNVQAPKLGRRYFFALGARGASGRYGRSEIARCPSVRVVGDVAVMLHVTAEPYQEIGKVFRLKVSAIDAHGNLDVNYLGTVRFASTDKLTHLPPDYTFTPLDRGTHSFQVSLNNEGLHTITADDDTISGTSNVIRACSAMPRGRIFFGDIHAHTFLSDDTKWIDDDYVYARDVAGLDFAATSDHSDRFDSPENPPAVLREEDVTTYSRKYHRPHRFVTFPSYEWTRGFGYGHLNPIFKEESEFVICNNASPLDTDPETTYRTTPELLDALQGREVLTPPHHTASALFISAAGMDWEHYDAEFMPLVEISSTHGSSEYMDAPPQRHGPSLQERTVQHALGPLGLKFGIYCSSDAHVFHMGSLIRDPVDYDPRCGQRWGGHLMCLYAAELTRDALWDTMKNTRQMYGTTGERILLEFHIDGNTMGAEIVKSSPPELHVTVGGTKNLEKVEVIKYSRNDGWETIHTEEPSARICELAFTDSVFSEDSLYYIRVTQVRNRELAWSSPIWVNRG